MSNEEPQIPPDAPAVAAAMEGSSQAHSHKASSPPGTIYLISYPKIVFLYPTFFMALLAGLIILFSGEVDVQHSRTGEVATLMFLGVLTLNLCVVTFDFPRC
jgi:hypothetical protein